MSKGLRDKASQKGPKYREIREKFSRERFPE